MAFFLISSMVLDLLDQLQIFLQLYLIEFVGLLRGLRLLKILITKLSLMEFHLRYLALFLLLPVIDNFKWEVFTRRST